MMSTYFILPTTLPYFEIFVLLIKTQILNYNNIFSNLSLRQMPGMGLNKHHFFKYKLLVRITMFVVLK